MMSAALDATIMSLKAGCKGFARCHEARSEIGEIGAHDPCGGNIRPVLMAPPSTIIPPNTSRISATRANGLIVPVCPPAPALTAMMPSTPACDAFSHAGG